MIITTTVEIPPRRIADLMVSAIEGGVGYWCKSVKLVSQPPLAMKQPWYDDERFYQDGGYYDNKGGHNLVIEVIELDPSSDINNKGIWKVYLVNMERAFRMMQEYGTPKGFHFQNFINENDDAETADVWFQLAVFGEVVYG